MKASPCVDCEERTVSPNCHTNCIAYREWTGERKKENKRRDEFQILFHEMAANDRATYGRRKVNGT